MTDSRLIDVNFESAPFANGCLPRDDKVGSVFPVLEDSGIDIYQRNDWEELLEQAMSLEVLIGQIKDQGQEGSCASQATAQAMEIVWNLQHGQQSWVPLSPMSLYKRVGSSASSGSTIASNLVATRDVGILPLNTQANKEQFEHTHPAIGWNASLPSGWKNTAKKFRVTEWYDIASIDGLITAIINGWPVVYGRQVHAICSVLARWNRDRKIAEIKYANSWSPSWGDNGYGWDSEKVLRPAIPQYGAFCVRQVTVDDEFDAPVAK